MKPDAKEIARVDTIHQALDSWHASLPCWGKETTGLVGVGEVELVFTRAEVAAWPSVKRSLRGLLAAEPDLHTAAHIGNGHGHWSPIIGLGAGWGYPEAEVETAIARGLCMYRESAAFRAAPDSPSRQEPSTSEAGLSPSVSPEAPGVAAVTNESRCAKCGCSGYANKLANVGGGLHHCFECNAPAGLVVAALTRPPALPDRSPSKPPSKHDARPRDLDQSWSSVSWEEG